MFIVILSMILAYLAFGETVTIAEEMAAKDALYQIFEITNNSAPLPFGPRGRFLRLDVKNKELVDLPENTRAQVQRLKSNIFPNY